MPNGCSLKGAATAAGIIITICVMVPKELSFDKKVAMTLSHWCEGSGA